MKVAIAQGGTTLATTSVMTGASRVSGRMLVAIEPTASGASVRCGINATINIGDAPVGFVVPPLTAEVAMSSGNVGFGGGRVTAVHLLAIYDRDDAPPL